jgi:putative membrane protein
MLFFLAQNWGQGALQGGGRVGVPELSGRWFAGGGALLVLLLAAGGGLAVLSWRMTRFRVTEEALELRQGILFRRHRQARLDRVQSVDLVQPFLARLAGLARITLEVAGGSGSSVALSYLTEAQATDLRNHLLARAAGVSYEGETAPEAPERHALEVPVTRLLGSLALSGPAIALVLGAAGVAIAAVVVGQPGPLVVMVPWLLGTVGALWSRFSGGFGFRVAISPDGLRLRHGLLEQRRQTVPPGRVQAVRISQSLLWRSRDWWTVRANIAGYGAAGGPGDSGGDVLLAVGTRDEAVGVLALVLPDLGVLPSEAPGAVVDAGLTGRDPADGYLTAPPRARWVDPIGWRRIGVRVTGEAVLIRRGVLWRRLDIVPHARTQSLGVVQGPLQRRLGLASFRLHSTPGPVVPEVPHLTEPVAARLLAEQAVRAEAARAAAGPERWMRPDAVLPQNPATGGPAPAS